LGQAIRRGAQRGSSGAREVQLQQPGEDVVVGEIRRPPSKLGEIQPDHWLAEYTSEFLNVLNVLALLVEMEPAQSQLLEAICDGPTLDFRG
jgi:hypothetical protein